MDEEYSLWKFVNVDCIWSRDKKIEWIRKLLEIL
jgi:hypothetical protein